MARRQRGFTLVELMVTVAIATFLLAGLVPSCRTCAPLTSTSSRSAQLQDQQRFAMTVLTDVIQAGGYFPTLFGMNRPPPCRRRRLPGGTGVSPAPSPPASPTASACAIGTANSDGVILCDGSSNTASPRGSQLYTNVFTVVPPAGAVPGELRCTLTIGAAANAPLTLITGVQGLTIYYGVKRNPAVVDYNVDTYLTANQMLVAGPNGNDWLNISAVRVILQFNNPLFGQPGQPQFITFERVIEVMARAGVHT